MNKETIHPSRPYLQYVALALVFLACFVIQSAPRNLLTLFSVRPVLLTVLTVCVGVVYGEMLGGVMGLAAGLLMDLYAAPSVGFNTLVLTVLGILCGLAVKHLLMNNFLSAMVLCFAGSVVYFFLYWLLFKVILSGGGGWLYLVRFSLPAALYTGLFGLVFCPLLEEIRRRL